jgi:hypothetical protein
MRGFRANKDKWVFQQSHAVQDTLVLKEKK